MILFFPERVVQLLRKGNRHLKLHLHILLLLIHAVFVGVIDDFRFERINFLLYGGYYFVCLNWYKNG